MPGQRGQLSIEYLLLLLAVMAVFAFLLPLLNHVYHLALFGFDSANAGRFVQSVDAAVAQMRFLADGSAKTITAYPSIPWTVYAEGKSFTVVVKDSQLAAEKRFVAPFPNAVRLQPRSFSESRDFLIKKSDSEVLIEYS